MIAGYWMVVFHLVPSPPSLCPLPPARLSSWLFLVHFVPCPWFLLFPYRVGKALYFPGPGIHSLLYAAFPQRIIMFWNWKWPQMGKTGKVQVFTEPLMCARPWTRAFFFFCIYSSQQVCEAGSITSHFTDEKTEIQRGETTSSRLYWMVTDKGSPIPPSPSPTPSMPQFVFEDFLGCFKLGRYTSYREQGAKKKYNYFCFLKQKATVLSLHSPRV